MPDSSRICFFRYGETDWDRQMRVLGHIDMPLIAAGEAQAETVGRRFAGFRPPRSISSSDLLRARQRAQSVGVSLGLPVIPLPGLRAKLFALEPSTGTLHEYILKDYLLLYALIGRTIYLLSIRHQRQLSFDFLGHWGSIAQLSDGKGRLRSL